MGMPIAAADEGTTWYNTVFVDTSLDTHLAMIVSSADTVSDLKNRIAVEHALCFPEIGDINVHALKVKRRGYFYHLSESMLVKSAFHGVKKSRFISVDASSVADGNNNKNSLVSIPANVVAGHVSHLDDDEPKRLLKGSSSSLQQDENNQRLVLGTAGTDGGGNHASGEINATGSHKRKKENQDIEKDVIRGIENEGEEGNLENDNGYVQGKVLEERAQETGSDKKKKHKSKKKRTAVEDLLLENTIQEYGKSGVELCQDELVHKGNKNISDGDCINASSDACKRSDTLFQRIDGPEGGSNEHQNDLSKSKTGDCYVEDPSYSQPAAKKKRKREKKKGDENSVKEDRTLIPDYKKETLGHPTNTELLTEEKNKISAPSPTENVKNVHIQPASPSSGKRKGKNKSAKEEISPAAALDVKGEDSRATKAINTKDLDEETNAASVPGEHVQGLPTSDHCTGKGRLTDAVQESNDRLSSQGINTSDIDIGNAESRHEASEQETAYSARRVKSSKDHDAFSAGMHSDVLSQEPNDREKGDVASGDENFIHNKGKREKTPNIHPKTMQEEKSKLLVVEEENTKSREAKLKSPEVSEMGDGKKLSKKRKNSKKPMDLDNGEQFTSARERIEGSINGISLTEAPNHGDNSGGIVAKEDSHTASKKRKEISEVDAGSTSVLATDREIDDVIQNVVESVNKITETLVDTEHVDRKSRKKSKKKQRLQTNNLPELQAENWNVCHKDHLKEADSTSKTLRYEKDTTVQGVPLAAQLNSVGFNSSELPPEKLKVEKKAKTGDGADTGCHMQASCENNRINFEDYFVPSQIDHENVALREVPTDKATKLMGANGKLIAKKKKKNLNVHPSPEVHLPAPSLNENQKEKPQPGGKSSNMELELSVSNARDETIKSSEVSGGGVRAMPSNESDKLKSGSDEARRYDATKLPKGRRTKIDKEAGAASVSSLESSKNTMSPYKIARGHQSYNKHNNAYNKKASIPNSGEVVNSSPHDKRLIGTPGAIFKADIPMPSADEDGSDSSDATTSTPSDNLPSSDYSDGESSADISSSQSGSSSLKRKEGSRKNSSKLLSSGMSLDAILRSSSRYKKAKLTASQSQLEDTESQPVDFVPESEPIY